jgi:pilus assembly protein Flp/PilA
MTTGRLPKLIRAFLRAEEGITAIEYGLVAALISVGIMVAIGAIGDAVVALFAMTSEALPG